MTSKSIIALLALGFSMSTFAADFPLRVDINASAKTEKLNLGAGQDGEAFIERVSVNVTVKKESGQPWEHPVTVELYILGMPVNQKAFTVVEKVVQEFNFTKENDHTFKFKSPAYNFGETSGNINVGLQYETYLVIVTDHEGKTVETKCGRALDEKEMKLIRTLELNKIYDKDLNIIGTVENLKKATGAAVQSATDPGDDY